MQETGKIMECPYLTLFQAEGVQEAIRVSNAEHDLVNKRYTVSLSKHNEHKFTIAYPIVNKCNGKNVLTVQT